MIHEDRARRFLQKLKRPLYFRLFLLTRLPLALLAGLRLEEAGPEKTVVSIPFGYLSKNPFRSTYFAALSMAAEMSTGIPGFVYSKAAGKPVSMLLVAMDGRFSMKATGRTRFSFTDARLIRDAVDEAANSLEARTVEVLSIGRDREGNEVCRFRFTWSFKAKGNPLESKKIE